MIAELKEQVAKAACFLLAEKLKIFYDCTEAFGRIELELRRGFPCQNQ